MKRFLLFSLLLSCFLYSQENDEITNAIQIFCGDALSSSTVSSNTDQEYLTSVGLNECGTTVDGSAGVWYSF